MPKLFEIFKVVQWKGVAKSLKRIYEKRAYLSAHKAAFQKIQKLKPGDAKGMIIYIEMFEEDYDIHGKDGSLMKDLEEFKDFSRETQKKIANDPVTYGLEFRTWRQWLGMSVGSTPTSMGLSNEDIVALCLYEMTFVDYDEKPIKKRMDSLKRAIKNVKKQIAAGKFPSKK